MAGIYSETRAANPEADEHKRLCRFTAFAPQGRADILYVSNTLGDAVLKINSSGGVSTFAATGLSDPTGLAFDGAGNLYAGNIGSNTIEKFTPGGVNSTFATGLNFPEFFAFTNDSGAPLPLPIPEPTGASLLVFAISLVSRRRRAR